MGLSVAVAVGFVFLLFFMGVRVVYEYQRGVVFRLGKISKTKGPGFRWIIPFVDTMRKIDLRVVTQDVPPQDVITRDNVSVKVNAVIYFRVIEPIKAVLEVEDFLYATLQFAQTTLRSILGQVELDELLAAREKINERLQEVLDKHTDPWGIKVSAVEVKHVDLPSEMVRAIAAQAEAEREKRAKIIHAEGEFLAAERLTEAAVILSKNPAGLHLRYLQTLREIAAENNSTTVFPLPLELIRPFLTGFPSGGSKE